MPSSTDHHLRAERHAGVFGTIGLKAAHDSRLLFRNKDLLIEEDVDTQTTRLQMGRAAQRYVRS